MENETNIISSKVEVTGTCNDCFLWQWYSEYLWILCYTRLLLFVFLTSSNFLFTIGYNPLSYIKWLNSYIKDWSLFVLHLVCSTFCQFVMFLCVYSTSFLFIFVPVLFLFNSTSHGIICWTKYILFITISHIYLLFVKKFPYHLWLSIKTTAKV